MVDHVHFIFPYMALNYQDDNYFNLKFFVVVIIVIITSQALFTFIKGGFCNFSVTFQGHIASKFWSQDPHMKV